MRTFDLELRVTTFGSVITWKILLEDSTSDSQLVTGWLPSPEGFFFKQLPGYQIADHSLEVFAGCHGIRGGRITCEVLINGSARQEKLVSKVEDKMYAVQSFEV